MNTLPDIIEVTISEVDRQTAGRYMDGHNCLLCTALKNRGINTDMMGGTWAIIEGAYYGILDDGGSPINLRVSQDRESYDTKVVGKTIQFKRRTPATSEHQTHQPHPQPATVDMSCGLVNSNG